MQKNDVLLTGGHAATTAIAVIQEIKKTHDDWNLSWIGPRSAVEGKYMPTLAASIMPSLGVKFIPITTGRLQRKFTIYTIPSLFKIPYGIIQAFSILIKLKPKLVVSFGGYASVPVCFSAWFLQIPIIIHEQTVAAGLANHINSFFARKILIARTESAEYFAINKTILIGNPVSAQILDIEPKLKISVVPVIYITGGSSGAQRINNAVSEVLYELLKKYKVIHQTGKLDYEKFKKIKDEFPSDLKKNYEVYDFINPDEVSNIFERADLLVTRAGANTISEIMVTKRPSVIIPIPWTSHDEQTKNAKMAEKAGIGVVLEEKDLNGQNLLSKVEFVTKNWKEMVKNSDDTLANLDKTAAKRFVEEIDTF